MSTVQARATVATLATLATGLTARVCATLAMMAISVKDVRHKTSVIILHYTLFPAQNRDQ